ncbi:MAG TPA: hypothetical protein VFS55_09060 [Dokdonella sp.]|nr:hypothetical protein [Dokdonella sp.]
MADRRLSEYLEAVEDSSSFMRFVECLSADRKSVEQLTLTCDGFQGEWANQSIADFLDAARTWAEDSAFGERQAAVRENPWKQFALFLWAGRTYE